MIIFLVLIINLEQHRILSMILVETRNGVYNVENEIIRNNKHVVNNFNKNCIIRNHRLIGVFVDLINHFRLLDMKTC